MFNWVLNTSLKLIGTMLQDSWSIVPFSFRDVCQEWWNYRYSFLSPTWYHKKLRKIQNQMYKNKNYKSNRNKSKAVVSALVPSCGSRLTEHSISGVYFFRCKVGTGLQFLVLKYSVFKGILQSTWDIFDRQTQHETNSYRKYVSYTFQATFRPYLSFQWLHQWNCIFSCLAWVQSYLIYTWISLLQLNFKGFLRHAQQNTTSTCLSPWSYRNDKF